MIKKGTDLTNFWSSDLSYKNEHSEHIYLIKSVYYHIGQLRVNRTYNKNKLRTKLYYTKKFL